MAKGKVRSVSGKDIYLDEAWSHIVEHHSEMVYYETEVFETIRNPDEVIKGRKGRLVATKYFKSINSYIVVVYKEFKVTGKVFTAYLSKRKINW